MEYDEDVTVNRKTEIYKVLLRLGPLQEPEVRWAPDGGQNIDLSRVHSDVTIDPRVASLMRHLSIRVGTDQPIASEMCAVDYRSREVVKFSRFIDRSNEMSSPCPGKRHPASLVMETGVDKERQVLEYLLDARPRLSVALVVLMLISSATNDRRENALGKAAFFGVVQAKAVLDTS